MASGNLRRHERKRFPASIRVSWQDHLGDDKSVMTRSFDISETGVRFELHEALLPRSGVIVRGDKLGLQTRATVRFCERKGTKYAVGVEFAGGYRWHPPSEAMRVALMEAEMLVEV
jgi:hypothetical protein